MILFYQTIHITGYGVRYKKLVFIGRLPVHVTFSCAIIFLFVVLSTALLLLHVKQTDHSLMHGIFHASFEMNHTVFHNAIQ